MSERRDKSKMLKPGVSSATKREIIKEESGGIDQNLLEKRLEGLRDTQESVQGLSLWCQANKRHSSAIIETWLKILKKGPVEKRLTLFYLANDVVQHAKRKNDATVVNQWAVAVQKATPQVRTPSSVSSAIARIFKIWEERSVYSKETTADLLALLNNISAKERVGEKKKPETYTASVDKVAAFQTSTLISKVKLAYRLKSHLGVTFRAKPFVYMDIENLKGSIKDRSHGMEVIQEIGQLVEQLKTSELKLSVEVDERRKIVETAEIAIVHYENVRGEANIVNSAYKNFTERVESTRDNVIAKFKSFEKMEIDSSPVPSPPPEAPSPPPDDDFDFGINQLHSTSSSTTNIRADIMDALKSTMSPNKGQHNSSGSSSLNLAYQTNSNSQNQQQHVPNSNLSQYDQSIPSLSAMQQQFQQNWGSNPTDNFAAMSAMIQHMLPGANNYLAMQQPPPNTYVPQQGYEAAYHQQQQQHHQSASAHLPSDVSSIPLPPSGPDNIPLPPPPQNQNMSSSNHHMSIPNNMNSPVRPNPYLTTYNSYDSSTSTVDSNEYVPLPYYKPQQQEINLNSSAMSYGSTSEFDSYPNSTPSTPTKQQQGSRYHPYHSNDRSSDASNNSSGGGQHNNSLLISPAYSNHSGSGGVNESSSRFYGGGNNSSISPPAVRSDQILSSSNFDPMEMFASALSKNKNNSSHNSQPSASDMLMGGGPGLVPMNPNLSTCGGGVGVTNSPFNPSDSFYPSGNVFNDINISNTNGGDDLEPYTPKPGMGNFFNSRGAPPHGLGGNNFSNNRPPRGHRGGMRGGLQSRGFSAGYRGRTPRGPPRGGRSRFIL